jgi:serine/threonine protein kinase
MVLERGVLFADKYEILDVLSAGAQATVYTALQKPLDRVVILKILSPALVANQEIVSRFTREAKLLSTLKDDNVTKIYDYGKHNGVYFFVSEYIEGQSVKELLEQKGRLSLQMASYIILESAKVLNRLHRQGIVHRDVKPGNILINHDGKIKLTDFGLAFSEAMPSITVEGSILGTPAYMSPEQILGKPIDNRSDIYSLGVVFYELLTGVNPFIANTYSAIMHNVLNLKPTPIFKIAPSLEETKDLWSIIEAMIKKQPGDRFEDINQVCEKLEIWFSKVDNKTWIPDIEILSGELKKPVIPTRAKSKRARIYYIFLPVLVILIAVVSLLAIRNRHSMNIIKQTVNKIDTTGQTDTLSPIATLLKPNLPVRQNPLVVSQPNAETDAIRTRSGYLKISVLPWAKVYIDGEEIFTTPKDTAIELLAGQYNIKLVNPNFPGIESVVTIHAKQNLNVVVDLAEQVSYLQIAVTPWADIFIDDVFQATTPISQPLIIASGKHKLTVKNPYYSPYEETIEFKTHETIEKNIILK